MAGVHTGIVAVKPESLDRWIQLGLASGRVINLAFPDERPSDATEDHPLADRLIAYLDRAEPDEFADVQLALTVPTEHRHVYETLREIQYGRSLTFDELVGAVPLEADDEDASRAMVRDALRSNPIPLIVPDHRISDAEGATPSDVRRAARRIEGLD